MYIAQQRWRVVESIVAQYDDEFEREREQQQQRIRGCSQKTLSFTCIEYMEFT
jgi:hypothetical protein